MYVYNVRYRYARARIQVGVVAKIFVARLCVGILATPLVNGTYLQPYNSYFGYQPLPVL